MTGKLEADHGGIMNAALPSLGSMVLVRPDPGGAEEEAFQPGKTIAAHPLARPETGGFLRVEGQGLGHGIRS